MSVTLKQLYTAEGNPFSLELRAGRGGSENIVSWIYMLEDEHIIPWFKGGELAVTTGVKQAEDSSWSVRRLFSIL